MTTDTGIAFVEMRVSKVVGLAPGEDELVEYVVLDEVSGDRHLLIMIGRTEAFSLAATLNGIEWPRPMTYQFMAALLRSLGARVRQVRLDRLVDGAYAATVEVEGAHGAQLVDARASDALNLAALVDAPVFAAPEVLEDCERQLEGDSADAAMMRRALTARSMTIRRAEI
jgi:bifunctional DNase/RNase